MVASYSQTYFILTQDPGDLLRILQGKSRKLIGMRAQTRYITMEIHIVLEETYGRYNLHQKRERLHLS